MYGGGGKGQDREIGEHQRRYVGNGARQPRMSRRKPYLETDASPTSAVLLKPIPEELKWKFTQREQEYTRYELKLEERHVHRSVPTRHRDNLQDIQKNLVEMLKEPFEKTCTCSYELGCQARLGKVVWLGDLVEHGQRDISGMQLRQFEGPPHKPHLKNNFVVRATLKDSIMAVLEGRHGAHDGAHNSLHIMIRDVQSKEKKYTAFVSKDCATGKFCLEKLHESDGKLGEFASDMVCFERFHDVRISTQCYRVEQPQATPHITTIIDSIKLSEHGELEMILKSGPLQVVVIRRREKHAFSVEEERDWLITYTKVNELLFSLEHSYEENAMIQVDNGHDIKELEVILERTIDQSVNIKEVVEEIMRLIEFSLEIVEVSDKHLDL